VLSLDVRFIRNPKGHKRVHQGRYTNKEAATTMMSTRSLKVPSQCETRLNGLKWIIEAIPIPSTMKITKNTALITSESPTSILNLFFHELRDKLLSCAQWAYVAAEEPP